MSTFIPKIEKLSALVTRILGCNASPVTLQGTNSYLVGRGNSRILIDTSNPGISEYTDNLQKFLQGNNLTLQEILVTHWHIDHVGAIPDVATKLIRDPNKIKVSKIMRHSIPDQDIGNLAEYNFVKDGDIFKTDGATLRVMFTPGHTEEHMALYLEEENAVFAGDTVLGESSCIFEDLYDYMKSLNKILSLKPGKIYPGHGPVVEDAVSKVTQYIAHRNARENELVDVLKRNENQWFHVMDLVKMIYTDTPENLHLAAAKNVFNCLVKLKKEGRIDTKGVMDEPLDMEFKKSRL